VFCLQILQATGSLEPPLQSFAFVEEQEPLLIYAITFLAVCGFDVSAAVSSIFVFRKLDKYQQLT